MTSGKIKIAPVTVLGISRWYDNEWGYSNRCVDLAIFIGNKLKDLGKSNPQKVPAKA